MKTEWTYAHAHTQDSSQLHIAATDVGWVHQGIGMLNKHAAPAWEAYPFIYLIFINNN